MVTEAQRRAAEKYHRQSMEQITIRAKKADRLADRIKEAAARRNIYPARYVRQAIEAALDADGVPAPDPDDNTTPGD